MESLLYVCRVCFVIEAASNELSRLVSLSVAAEIQFSSHGCVILMCTITSWFSGRVYAASFV